MAARMHQENPRGADKDSSFVFSPIGVLETVFLQKNGTPRQPTMCSSSRASLTIDKSVFNNPDHSLLGLDEYSHLWLLFVFHLNNNACTKAKVKPPRLNGAKLGLFATRSPYRPSPIGLTLAKIVSVEGDTINLSGVDIVNGTPILDIKPYIPEYDNPTSHITTTAVPSSEMTVTANSSNLPTPEITCQHSTDNIQAASWLREEKSAITHVSFTNQALEQLSKFQHGGDSQHSLTFLRTVEEAQNAVREILLADPRSSYRRQSCSDRLYYFVVDTMHITCWFDESMAQVLKVQPVSAAEQFTVKDN